MADKVQVIVTDEQGKDIPFGTKTLTAEFQNKQGKKYKVAIQEPGKARVNLGDYTVGGDGTVPPVCGAHSHWDGGKCACDPGYHDENGTCVPDVIPQECPAGQHWDGTKCIPDVVVPPGNILWDSNRDIDWSSLGGQKKIVNKFGNLSANGKGFYTAASGSPKVEMDPAEKTLKLITQPGFGRLYICACNYNASVEYDFNVESGSVDNLSDKWRNRHQMGGSCDNRPGGIGSHVGIGDGPEVGFKDEQCHNIQGKGTDGKLPKPIEINKWYKSKFTFQDSPDGKSILKTRSLDYQDGNGFVKVLEHEEKNPFPTFMNKAAFEKESQGWLRLNGSGSIVFTNILVMAL